MSTPFNPDTDMGDCTSGIGKAAVLAFASHHPMHLVFTGRDEKAGRTVCEEVNQRSTDCKVTFIQCDLSAPRQVIRKALRDNLHATRLDIFVANAGIMAVPAALTTEGFEVQFGTNYLGHAVMLRLLRPLMLRTAEAAPSSDIRVIMLSSFGHTMHLPEGIDFDHLRKANEGSEWQRYSQSKLANILLAKDMAKRYPTITSLSAHPGLVKTGLLKGAETSMATRMFVIMRWIPSVYLDAEHGAYNVLWAATTLRTNVENGAYYEPIGRKAGKKTARSGASELCDDAELADKLWE